LKEKACALTSCPHATYEPEIYKEQSANDDGHANEEAKQRDTAKSFQRLASLQHLTPQANAVRPRREW
jgi:hypothetical protein